MITKNIRTNNEFYIAPTFNEIIQNGGKIFHYPIAEMYGLGTPEDLQHFLKISDRKYIPTIKESEETSTL